MPKAAAPPSGSSDPLHGHQPIPQSPARSTEDNFSPPPMSADSSPLGLAGQYHRAPNIPSLHNQRSVTGATPDDPAGELTRQQVVCDPEWASPLRGIWNVMTQGYLTSMLTYWLCYGFMLMLGLGLAQWFLGGSNLVTPDMMAEALVVGPFNGFVMDFSLIFSQSAATIGGLALLGAEVILAIMFFTTFEWRARLKYCGLLFVLVLVKMLLYVWVSTRR